MITPRKTVRALLVVLAAASCVATQTSTCRDREATTAADGSFEPIDLLAWNVNVGARASNDQQLPFIESVFAKGSDFEIIALSEVAPGWMDGLSSAANRSGRSYGSVRGSSGCRMRLMILFAEDRFEFLGSTEMTGVPQSQCARAPLVVTLRDRLSGQRFEVVSLHLFRGSGREGERRRAEEARELRRALARGGPPVLVIGDVNADCPIPTAPEGCALAFSELVSDGLLHWIPPTPRAETTCRTDLNDMLDLVLVGRGAEQWRVRAEVLSDPEYCARMASGAHYPITATVLSLAQD